MWLKLTNQIAQTWFFSRWLWGRRPSPPLWSLVCSTKIAVFSVTWITWSYHRLAILQSFRQWQGLSSMGHSMVKFLYFSLLVVSDTFAVSILNYVGRISSLESLQNSGMVNSPFLPSHRKQKYQLSKSERHFLQVKSPIVKSQFVEEGISEIQHFAAKSGTVNHSFFPSSNQFVS